MSRQRTEDESADSQGDETTVAFVDDESELVEVYALMLKSEYSVLTATSASEALNQIDETVDIVFLDRRMPDMSGDELLAELRQRGYQMPVAMLSAVDPAEDIVDMPFDDYVTKPVDKDKLLKKVETLLNRAEFDSTSRKFYSLASKKTTLEAEGIDDSNREAYHDICQRMDEMRTKIDETLDDLMDDDSDAAFGGL